MDPKKDYNPEEEVATEGQWKMVDLKEVETKTGEETMEEVFSERSKLYRWRNDQWNERGIGNFRILKNKSSGHYSAVLRQEVTHKIFSNFFIIDYEGLCTLARLKTQDKSWMWSCIDSSDGAPQLEKFCVRFKTKEHFEDFEKQWNIAKTENAKFDWGFGEKEEEKEAETEAETQKEEDKKEEAQKEEEKAE